MKFYIVVKNIPEANSIPVLNLFVWSLKNSSKGHIAASIETSLAALVDVIDEMALPGQQIVQLARVNIQLKVALVVENLRVGEDGLVELPGKQVLHKGGKVDAGQLHIRRVAECGRISGPEGSHNAEGRAGGQTTAQRQPDIGPNQLIHCVHKLCANRLEL